MHNLRDNLPAPFYPVRFLLPEWYIPTSVADFLQSEGAITLTRSFWPHLRGMRGKAVIHFLSPVTYYSKDEGSYVSDVTASTSAVTHGRILKNTMTLEQASQHQMPEIDGTFIGRLMETRRTMRVHDWNEDTAISGKHLFSSRWIYTPGEPLLLAMANTQGPIERAPSKTQAVVGEYAPSV